MLALILFVMSQCASSPFIRILYDDITIQIKIKSEMNNAYYTGT